MYSACVLEHFQHPRNAGALPGADACATVNNPACGDVLELALKTASGRIVEVRFRAKGCVSAIACGSQMTELVLQKTLTEARGLRSKQIIDALGGLPEASGHAAELAIDALNAALGKLAAPR